MALGPQGEGQEGCSLGSSGLCQEEGKTHPSKEKRHLSQRKMVVLGWGWISNLMKPTNGKGNKLPSLWNVRKIMFIFRRCCYDLQ